MVTAQQHEQAVRIFETRMGFEFTDDYEQSREWSDALAEAEEIRKPRIHREGEYWRNGVCRWTKDEHPSWREAFACMAVGHYHQPLDPWRRWARPDIHGEEPMPVLFYGSRRTPAFGSTAIPLPVSGVAS